MFHTGRDPAVIAHQHSSPENVTAAPQTSLSHEGSVSHESDRLRQHALLREFYGAVTSEDSHRQSHDLEPRQAVHQSPDVEPHQFPQPQPFPTHGGREPDSSTTHHHRESALHHLHEATLHHHPRHDETKHGNRPADHFPNHQQGQHEPDQHSTPVMYRSSQQAGGVGGGFHRSGSHVVISRVLYYMLLLLALFGIVRLMGDVGSIGTTGHARSPTRWFGNPPQQHIRGRGGEDEDHEPNREGAPQVPPLVHRAGAPLTLHDVVAPPALTPKTAAKLLPMSNTDISKNSKALSIPGSIPRRNNHNAGDDGQEQHHVQSTPFGFLWKFMPEKVLGAADVPHHHRPHINDKLGEDADHGKGENAHGLALQVRGGSATVDAVIADSAVDHGAFDHLVMVPGHGVYKGKDITKYEDEDNWCFEAHQRNVGLVHAIERQIQKALDIAAKDPRVLVLFSGGQTRNDGAARSEGQTYLDVAIANDFKHAEELFGGATVGAARAVTKPRRLYAEEHARDSYENVVFAACRFFEITGHWPKRYTVVGFQYKEPRFTQLHRVAMRWPISRWAYVGVRAVDVAVGRPELSDEKTYHVVKNDMYICKTGWPTRQERNPNRNGIPYYASAPPAVVRLLLHCGPELFAGALPWNLP